MKVLIFIIAYFIIMYATFALNILIMSKSEQEYDYQLENIALAMLWPLFIIACIIAFPMYLIDRYIKKHRRR